MAGGVNTGHGEMKPKMKERPDYLSETIQKGNPGLIAVVEKDRCKGCGKCVFVCDHEAASLISNISQIDRDRCNGCGMCVLKCKHHALSLRKA